MNRSLFIVVLLFALGGCGMSGGSGIVLETGAGKPIAGATVTLKCRREKFPEGSELVKTLMTTTDVNGRFKFSALDVAVCGFAYVTASKSGYVSADRLNLMYSHDDYATIPKQIVLTSEGGATMVRLEFLASMIKASSSPDHAYLYVSLYPNFEEAQRIAKSVSERAFVHASICPLLIDLHERLSEQDRVRIRGTSVMGLGGLATVDHEGQLEPYCKASLSGG